MKHKFSSKILCVAADEAAFRECVSVFAEQAEVYRVTEDAEGRIVLVTSGGGAEPLLNPLLGPTVLALFDTDVPPALIAQISAVWEDALLPAPMQADATAGSTGLKQIGLSLMSLQTGLVTDAMRRNVSLLTQVAALRQRCENLNTVVGGLKQMISQTQSGAHRLLYESTPWGEPVTLQPSQKATQRLPIAVMPSLIGAVSLTVSATRNTSLTARLVSVETDTVVEELSVPLASGKHLFFMPVRDTMDPNARFVDIEFENTGTAPLALETALQESPEEALRMAGGAEIEGGARSLNLSLWSPGPGKGTSFETESTRRLIPSWDIWRNSAKPLTPGFESREWVAKRGAGGLLIHPLPETTAIASCPLKARGAPYVGVQGQFSLADKAASVVQLRLILTADEPTFETAEEAAAFAAADATEADIARGAWENVPPGSSRPAAVFADTGQRDCFLNIAVTTNGQAVDFAHFLASGLELIVE